MWCWARAAILIDADLSAAHQAANAFEAQLSGSGQVTRRQNRHPGEAVFPRRGAICSPDSAEALARELTRLAEGCFPVAAECSTARDTRGSIRPDDVQPIGEHSPPAATPAAAPALRPRPVASRALKSGSSAYPNRQHRIAQRLRCCLVANGPCADGHPFIRHVTEANVTAGAGAHHGGRSGTGDDADRQASLGGHGGGYSRRTRRSSVAVWYSGGRRGCPERLAPTVADGEVEPAAAERAPAGRSPPAADAAGDADAKRRDRRHQLLTGKSHRRGQAQRPPQRPPSSPKRR